MISQQGLLSVLNELLLPHNYQDYCHNGLQVEGSDQISTIVTGVSISEELIDAAITLNAQAIIVHHGLFWQKEAQTVCGSKRNRLAKLLKHNINLFAYHLPLDNHQSLGNNAQLANLLDIKISYNCGEQGLLWIGELAVPLSLASLKNNIEPKLGRVPLCLGKPDEHLVKTIAWCTGGAANFFTHAISLGVDAYITGEAAEPSMHLAKESNCAFIAAGHFASERYGIMALGEYLASNHPITNHFIELYNPV